ncbi:sensor histidine kinase [Flavobacterium psychrotrophum]|uniref:sensor histidine kinase n=1 Tax=Flavobacterium psychrotrophum TaxID=2294119 RepID=UPI000E323EA2|nr:ATP-binding protein [Flavobacterium psychrotrophum]
MDSKQEDIVPQVFKSNDQRYLKMIEEVQDYAIILLDRDGTILNWNKGAEKIKGYPEKEIVGKNFSCFYLKEDRKTGLPQHLIKEAALNGRAKHEGWRLRKDGSTFWGYIVITALHGDNEEVIGFSKVTRDLTERKLAEDRRDRDARNIALQNKQLEEFAYITSHDLQEPVRKIQTFAKLLEKNISDEGQVQKYLEKINLSANRMVTLIKSVLDYSRLSQTQEQFIDTDLNTVLQAVKEDFEVLFTEKDVTIIADDLPVIKAIPIQMHQLFFNLIGNSIKFNTHEPLIEISTGKFKDNDKHFDSETEYLLLQFTDNGIGFDQKYADQAFQPFKRLNSDYSGTGIGLALCKRIVDNHKGYIEVRSAVNKGTTFEIYLPM